ncbi:MAG: hypothetical protein ACC645_28070 [Pirellulales bacterium]
MVEHGQDVFGRPVKVIREDVQQLNRQFGGQLRLEPGCQGEIERTLFQNLLPTDSVRPALTESTSDRVAGRLDFLTFVTQFLPDRSAEIILEPVVPVGQPEQVFVRVAEAIEVIQDGHQALTGCNELLVILLDLPELGVNAAKRNGQLVRRVRLGRRRDRDIEVAEFDYGLFGVLFVSVGDHVDGFVVVVGDQLELTSFCENELINK